MDAARERSSYRGMISILATIGLVAAALVQASASSASESEPGVGGPPQVVHFGSLLPIVNETGFISLSENAVGTNDPAGALLTINKPAGATVRKAYMAAATTGLSGATLIDGDVKIDGADVNWDVSTPNAIGSNDSWSEHHQLVKTKLDGAVAGPVSFQVTEANTFSTEGEIVAVIFDDPNQTVGNTISLLFGAQNVTGDTFGIGLAGTHRQVRPESEPRHGPRDLISTYTRTSVSSAR